MALTVAIIAQGEMGAAIARRLTEQGARVLTSLRGRSEASAARANDAGMIAIDDDAQLVAEADYVISVIPPGDAISLARRLAPVLAASRSKPIFIEGNAISPARVREVAAIITPAGCPFVDGGLVGAPPSPGKSGARFYVSGAVAERALALRDYGLDIRKVQGDIGAASALKCSYATLSKGTQALGIAMMLSAMRSDVAPELRRELAESQAPLRDYLARQIPDVYRKAYRWVAEMEEIADYLGATADPAMREIFRGTARLYETLAEGDKIALLEKFLER